MKRRTSFFIVCSCVTVLIGSVWFGSVSAAEKDWPTGVTIGSAPMGSTYFILLSGWGDLLSKKLGIKAAVESTGGPAANVVLIDKKQIDLGAATNIVLYQGLRGDDWAKGQKYQSARTLLPLYSATFHIYAPADRGIKSIYDLNGKRVCPGASATTPGILGPMIWKILGVKPAKVVNLGWSDANSAIQDGMLDAVQGLMGLPFPSCVELSSTHNVVISSIPKKDIPKVINELPLLGETVVPANTYKGQTEPVPTIDVWGFLLASKDLSADLAYHICKTTIDNLDTLISVHSSAKQIKDLEATKSSVVPLHRGAVRYLKEKGIAIPEKLIPPELK